MHPLLHPLFIDFLKHFNGDRDYFECHEVLEDYWKEVNPGNKEHPLTSWIQLATGLYHWRRNNFHGASRMLSKSFRKMMSDADSEFYSGIQMDQLLSDIRKSIEAVENQEAFTPFKLHLSPKIFGEVLDVATLDEQFGKTETEWLIHKHMRRDRSHILTERQANLEERKRDRS